MGIPDNSILNLLEKVGTWISWGTIDLSQSCLSGEFDLSNNGITMCSECNTNSTKLSSGYYCHSCGKWLCIRCVKGCDESPKKLTVGSNGGFEEAIRYCKFCSGVVTLRHGGGGKTSEKVHPSESPGESPEPPSPFFGGESIRSDQLAHYLESRDCGYSPHAVTNKFMTSFSTHPSPVSVRQSSSRSDDEEADESVRHFYSPSSEYCNDISDVDSNSISARNEFYSSRSVGSSPLDSPSRIDFTSYRVGHAVQRGQEGSPLAPRHVPFDHEAVAVLRRPKKGTEDPENTDEYSDSLQTRSDKPQKPLDFESNGLIWLPPPPEDENDEAESNFFTYDDDDDDVGDSGTVFSASTSLSNTFTSKLKQNDENKGPLRAVIQGHFRALVSQLLQGESIQLSKADGNSDWLDIVTTMAWQAANFVKPDTSRGGSMDPVDYVKVKCIASGKPSDSTIVKGVVCSKNIKHKRMTTQYKNPKLLILGGALEYQNVVVDHDGQKKNVVNQLASFNTLVQQENDYLKMIISKIEALRPNVLLVEKSVSPYAQEYLLAKEISLVLNVKRPILELISRCTGALISPSIDSISTTRLGHCELFHVERVTEEHECSNQNNRKPTKTLMFFEGCPRRLGCTVLLRGSSREELKKVKHVIQYAVFAAYHLSLETSFLADEGASLPKMTLKRSIGVPEKATPGNASSVIPSIYYDGIDGPSTQDDGSIGFMPEHVESESLSGHFDANGVSDLPSCDVNEKFENELPDAYEDDLAGQLEDLKMATITSNMKYLPPPGLQDTMVQEETQLTESHELTKSMRIDDDEISSEYFSAADSHQSILVSFSSRCVLKGTVCERSRLLRIKFYGSFDKPLGRYLRDDLFDQTSYCRSCKEPAEAHVLCYTHQQGNLTINVRFLSSMKLPGERDGKIWMWHRCLRCAHKDGVPPATRRVVMSDAAWGLSFGKFLELSFSNHATANRVAPCGHSLRRDCLRFYGFGSMVAFFRYSPVDILNVHLPPSVLEFSGHIHQDWIRNEAAELLAKMETYYAEIFDALDSMELRSKSIASELPDTSELQNHIMILKDQLRKERNDYHDILQLAAEESSQPDQTVVDILELNRLRRALLIGSRVWDRQLYSLDSLLKTDYVVKVQGDGSSTRLNELFDSQCMHNQLGNGDQENINLKSEDSPEHYLNSEHNECNLSCGNSIAEELILSSRHYNREEESHSDGELVVDKELVDQISSQTSSLSERIDSAWTGTDHLSDRVQPIPLIDGCHPENVRQKSISDGRPMRRMMAPVRVQSFDSALRFQERIRKVSTLRSFHASGDYQSMVRDPVSNAMRTYSQVIPVDGQNSNLVPGSAPTFISSASLMAGGARLLLPPRNHSDIVVGVYDNDPASIVSYALSSKDYEDWVAGKSYESNVSLNTREQIRVDSTASTFSIAWQSFGSVDLDYVHYGSYGGSEDTSSSIGSFFMDSKKSPHLTISYIDDSSLEGKVKFSVTCYFAKQFDSLRKRCCPSDVDFVRSLSRCQRWSAQGGKSNVYFAKSLDERFIIKQVKKTELESFEEFAPEYFKYLTDSLSSGSPTCLAKVLGFYQVSVKHLKGGKETKMDLMVMENLFFRRRISRVYDLKGSARSRYNPDTSGANKVLLDMNLVEVLRTEPIFLGSKAKRNLERAIWNDTSFLASVDVMDYSLLVGVDEEQKELVLGIIDFMRQYTWDKHLETWVKASGILGGPKNASPTIISPKQYKKRFRKAMTSYFLTVPDQWSS